MGCCSSAEEVRYKLPEEPLKISDMNDYLAGDENLDDQTLAVRIHEMIETEPDQAKHRVNYAIMMNKTDKKKSPEEMKQLFEDAIQCDPNSSRAYAAWARYLLDRGDQKGAVEKLEQGYKAIYRTGTRALTEDDVTLLCMYAGLGEESGISFPVDIGDIYKDAALNAPNSALAQGNYGLYLMRKNDRAAAQPRLKIAKDSGDPFWVERYSALGFE